MYILTDCSKSQKYQKVTLPGGVQTLAVYNIYKFDFL